MLEVENSLFTLKFHNAIKAAGHNERTIGPTKDPLKQGWGKILISMAESGLWRG